MRGRTMGRSLMDIVNPFALMGEDELVGSIRWFFARTKADISRLARWKRGWGWVRLGLIVVRCGALRGARWVSIGCGLGAPWCAVVRCGARGWG